MIESKEALNIIIASLISADSNTNNAERQKNIEYLHFLLNNDNESLSDSQKKTCKDGIEMLIKEINDNKN